MLPWPVFMFMKIDNTQRGRWLGRVARSPLGAHPALSRGSDLSSCLFTLSQVEGSLATRHCTFNRYTLQTKNAVTHTKQRTNELSIGTLFRSPASASSVAARRILFDTRVETESPVTPRKQRVAARSNRYHVRPFAFRFRFAQLPSPGGNILLKPGRSL